MSDITWDLAGRVVAVTGSAVGIGAGAVEAFTGAGAMVYGLDIDTDRGQQVAARTGSRFERCDVTSSTGVAETFDRISRHEGRLDVLVNNAGGFWEQHTTESTSDEEWARVIELNLTGVFHCARAAIPLLRRSTAGRIITVSSLAGQTAVYRSSPPYAAAKAGALALTRVLAYELASDGITANAISPSAVLTDRITVVRSEEERAATAASIPLGRYANVDDIVGWMLFLASAEAGFMTGETIAVNGGRFMA